MGCFVNDLRKELDVKLSYAVLCGQQDDGRKPGREGAKGAGVYVCLMGVGVVSE